MQRIIWWGVFGLVLVILLYVSKENKIGRYEAQVEPRLNPAELPIQEGSPEEAVKYYEKNLLTNANEENSLFGLAQAYLMMGKAEEALVHGKHLLDFSHDARILTNLGSLFAQYQYNNMAFACYIKAQKEDNFYKEVYLELGKLYGNLEKFNQAISVWQDGLLVDPNDSRFKDLILRAQQLKETLKDTATSGN